MNFELERQDIDRTQDIDDLIFDRDSWSQVSQR